MPYRLVDPKADRSPYYRVRGTHHGIRIDRSTQTATKATALRFLAQWRDEAEREALSRTAGAAPLTFISAASSYERAGGEAQFLAPLVEHFAGKLLAEIEQRDIDEAAVVLYPNGGAPTRNRAVYTPVSAIMRHAGIIKAIKRPKGAAGTPRTFWLKPEQAFCLLDAAAEVEPRFGALLTFLLYCGPRLSEALRLEWSDVDFERGTALLRDTKNGSPITVHMPPEAVAAIANLPRGRRVFASSKCGRIYTWLDAAEKKSGVILPKRYAFHALRHTHAMWRRLYTGADIDALRATGLWKSRNGAAAYIHVDVSDEAKKANLLPTRKMRKSGATNDK